MKKSLKKLMIFILCVSVSFIFSCNRDAIRPQNEIKELKGSPQYVDELPFKWEVTGDRIQSEYVDVNGDAHKILSKEEKSKQPRTMGVGCDDYDYTVTWTYRGYLIETPCFGGAPPQPASTYISFSWDLEMPADIVPEESSQNIARIRLKTFGWESAPSGSILRNLPVTYSLVSTFPHASEPGLMMKRWRVTSEKTTFSQGDWCLNQSFDATVRLQTDCMLFQQPISIFGFNNYRAISYMTNSSSTSTQKSFDVILQIPFCNPPTCKSYPYTNFIRFQWRKVGSLMWNERIRTTLANFMVPVYDGAGTYEYRYQCRLQDTPAEVLTDFISQTVVVL